MKEEWRRYVRVWRSDPAREIEDELQFHLELREREAVEAGASGEAARREAERAFGDRSRIEAELREIGRRRQRRARRASFLDDVAVDLLHSWRAIGRRPALPLLVVATLAVGIGGGTAVFSLFDAVVLNPIAVTRPAELVSLYEAEAGASVGLGFAYPMLHTLRESARGGTVAGHAVLDAGVIAGEHATQARTALVTGNYFGVLGVRPQRGRLLQPADEAGPGETPFVVLSDAFWRRAFGGDPDVVGRSVIVNRASFTVVGVAPAGFRGTSLAAPVDLWLPLSMIRSVGAGGLYSSPNVLETWHFTFIDAFARLRPGTSETALREELAALFRAAEDALPEPEGPLLNEPGPPTTVVSAPFTEAAVGRRRADVLRFLRVLALVVGIGLAVACVNVANLLLMRSSERARELSVRAALGARSGRLMRQLFQENLLLGLAAGVAGVGVAVVAIRLLAAFALPGGIALGELRLAPDARALAFTAALSLLCTVAFGLAPAFAGGRGDVMRTLREAAHGRRGRWRGGNALVTAQVALSLVLLVAGFLFLRSLQTALAVDLGFRPDGVATVSVSMRGQAYSPAEGELFVQRALEQAAARPGIVQAAAGTLVPVDAGPLRFFIHSPDRPRERQRLILATVTPGWVDLLGIPLVRGRDFAWSDAAAAPRVAIVTEEAARRLWPGEDPLGRELVAMFGEPYRVVGVTRDAHLSGLAEREPAVFLPQLQAMGLRGMESLQLLARGPDAAAALGSLRAAVRATDPRLPTFRERTLPDQLNGVLMPQRFGGLLLAVFGGGSLLVSGVGVYAVAAYDVARRRRELGIRAALGAGRRALIRAVLQRSGLAVTIGVLAGLALAAVVTRSLEGLLFGITPGEPTAYAAAAAALGLIAILAAWLPARRAARVDPLTVIRE